MNEIPTIKEAATLMQKKELSSAELVGSCLDRIESQNEKLNALLGVSSSALDEAKAIDSRRASGEELGPLAGIPIVLKDNILVKGQRATAGSRILENYDAAYDATVTERLRKAGAIIIGRANCDEFAMGSSTESSHYGPTKNPWDATRVPGGSSGGSAAAVAAGFAPCSLGSDTGGSIRQPASLSGIVGLKPTYGRVSRYGLVSLASSLDQIGPFARTVEDVALIMQAIEGDDPKDSTSIGAFDTAEPELIERSVAGMTFGVPKEYFVDGMDEGVKQCVMDAIAELQSAGASIKPISLPHTEFALAAYYVIQPAEASSNLGRYDGMRYGFSESGSTLQDTFERTRGEGFGKEVQRRIMIGSYVLSKGYYDAYYRKALQVRALIRQDFTNAFKEVDAIITPTSPSVAWPIGEKFNDPLAMYLADLYTVSANLAGIPGLSVPCGFVRDLPVGLQFLGKWFDEPTLYRAGMAYQELTSWHTRTP